MYMYSKNSFIDYPELVTFMERDIFIYICKISPIQTYNNENICTNEKKIMAARIMTFLKNSDNALHPYLQLLTYLIGLVHTHCSVVGDGLIVGDLNVRVVDGGGGGGACRGPQRSG